MSDLDPSRNAAPRAAFLFWRALATLAVAATWIWEVDRMQAPTLALLHYAGAIGIGKTISLLFRRAPAEAASVH